MILLARNRVNFGRYMAKIMTTILQSGNFILLLLICIACNSNSVSSTGVATNTPSALFVQTSTPAFIPTSTRIIKPDITSTLITQPQPTITPKSLFLSSATALSQPSWESVYSRLQANVDTIYEIPTTDFIYLLSELLNSGEVQLDSIAGLGHCLGHSEAGLG